MKVKHVLKWCLGLLLLGLLPLRGWGTEMGMAVEPQAVSPFLAAYRCGGSVGGDLAATYRLTWQDTALTAYSISPGDVPEGAGYLPRDPEGALAGKIRAVVRSGYPANSLPRLEEQANVWLRGQGMAQLSRLQAGEALTATQIALWQLTGAVQEGSYGGWKQLQTPDWKSLRDCALPGQEETACTRDNIHSLCAYLLALAPVAAETPLISVDALADARYQAEEGTDGTWRISLSVPLLLEPGAGDDLTLTVLCGEQTQSRKVTESGVYDFAFAGLPSQVAATVTLSGTRQGADVYLFSNGEMELVGYAAGTLPVDISVTLLPERVLRIQKSAGAQPLENIRFRLYLAATEPQLRTREVRLSDVPTVAEVDACQTPERLVAELTTDEQGQADFNFTSAGAPDGVYLVVEESNAAVTCPGEPFYITIPNEDGGVLAISLEGNGEMQPEVTLTVDGATEASFSPAGCPEWTLRGTLPAGLSNARSYALAVILPENLRWERSSLAVELETAEGERCRLLENDHYRLFGEPGVTLTPAGMAYAANQGEGASLVVTFRAAFGSDAPAGILLEALGQLEYTNAAGLAYCGTSPAVRAFTAGVRVIRTDETGKPLSGGKYRLARPASPGEKAATLDVAGQHLAVVYVDFCPEEPLSPRQTQTVSTDDRGVAWLSGLTEGTYYLVEASPPAGYRQEPPVAVTLTGENRVAEVTISGARHSFPGTGNTGVLLLTALGLSAMVLACWLLIREKTGV